jgi:hypothetical protein
MLLQNKELQCYSLGIGRGRPHFFPHQSRAARAGHARGPTVAILRAGLAWRRHPVVARGRSGAWVVGAARLGFPRASPETAWGLGGIMVCYNIMNKVYMVLQGQ